MVSQAVRGGQITRVAAEYLIQQRFQLAAMQYEVFSALHETLAFEIDQTVAAQTQRKSTSDSEVVEAGPCWKPCRATTPQ